MISQEIHENWSFGKKGTDKWLPAVVPGCVHTDLLSNKLISDPFFGENAGSLQWIETEDWEYYCEFNVSAYLIDHDRIELWFYGIDTYCRISLNGKFIIEAGNMFHPWNADVKNLIHEGLNRLEVIFFSPYKKGLEKYKQFPFQLPANNDTGEYRVSPFSRKAAFQYGWDWCPRMLSSGFWKNIELIAWNKLKIRDYNIIQQSLNSQYASLLCDLELEVYSAGEYIFALFVDKDLVSTGKLRLAAGITTFSLPFGIHNPKFWYPRGYGKPDVYKITIDIKDDNQVIDTRQTTTGLRIIELVREKDNWGESFRLRINKLDIYAKGANIVPLNLFLSEIKRDDYKKLIDNAVAANFNMIRVWGGGIYENDCFYNLCNKEGIMIWQDFMFACMMYPSDNEFIESVKEELDYNIKRLRNHPSVIIWCGNNEILEGFEKWGWKEQLGVHADEALVSYKKIFNNLIPKTLSALDPGRPYWNSSPYTSANAFPQLTSGDYHFWDIIKQPLPISSYEENIGRFMSEFGFKSYPELNTINSYCNIEDQNIYSSVMKFHQGWPEGEELVERHVLDLFGESKTFSDFIYFSQLTQLQAIKIAIESQRRSKPNCMGSLFWQFNDCWPSASWSAIDFHGNFKALYYELKNLFADIIISPLISKKELKVYVVSDIPHPINLLAVLRILQSDGTEIFLKEIEFTACCAKSEMIFSVSLEKLGISNIKNQVVLVSELFDEKKRLIRHLFYFEKPKDLDLMAEEPLISFGISGKTTMMVLQSNVLQKSIYIENLKTKGTFSDNYFDMIPGETKTVIFESETPDVTISDFRIRSLNKIIVKK